MNADYFRRLFDYNYWAHRRVWECVEALTESQFTQPCDYSIGSIHDQVVHTMAAEWLWLSRVNGVSPDSLFATADYPTRAAVRAKWDEVEAGWRSFVKPLQDKQLDDVVEYVSLTGKATRYSPLWEMLTQILNHGTDHRAQTLALIHQVGGKTVEQDFIFYSWE
jgi:uncharacterized damage-inducible protein DinB